MARGRLALLTACLERMPWSFSHPGESSAPRPPGGRSPSVFGMKNEAERVTGVRRKSRECHWYERGGTGKSLALGNARTNDGKGSEGAAGNPVAGGADRREGKQGFSERDLRWLKGLRAFREVLGKVLEEMGGQ